MTKTILASAAIVALLAAGSASAGINQNGWQTNALTHNGINQNGWQTNALTHNGLASNSLTINGTASNAVRGERPVVAMSVKSITLPTGERIDFGQ